MIHAVELALKPRVIGTRQVRRCRLNVDVLELGGEEALGETDAVRLHRIPWQRAGA